MANSVEGDAARKYSMIIPHRKFQIVLQEIFQYCV